MNHYQQRKCIIYVYFNGRHSPYCHSCLGFPVSLQPASGSEDGCCVSYMENKRQMSLRTIGRANRRYAPALGMLEHMKMNVGKSWLARSEVSCFSHFS